MTIGMIAVGPQAGLAVFRALSAVERIATGSIGGFAAFAAIKEDGTLFRAETQRGGAGTLFIEGETTGVLPPAAAATATMAAVIASGPDRPTPLSQFLVASPEAGLVTGHRLPNRLGASGYALNLEVLELLSRGFSADESVQRVMTANPEADAGILVCDRIGRVAACNSRRVALRNDAGHHRREERSANAIAEVLHNGVFPVHSLAAMATEIAMEVMVPRHRVVGTVLIRVGHEVRAGTANRVIVGADGKVLYLETGDKFIVAGRHNCAAVYLGSEVVQEEQLLGLTLEEPNVIIEDGRIKSLSGQTEVRIIYGQVVRA